MVQSLSRIVDVILGYFRDKLVGFVDELGSIALFAVDSMKLMFTKPNRYNEMIKHMEFVGNQSIGIICLTGLFTGLALSLQIYLGFKMFNAVNMVGRWSHSGSRVSWVRY